MSNDSTNRELKITGPIEVTVRLGDPLGSAATAPAIAPLAKTLTRGAEKIAVDQDYSTRARGIIRASSRG